MPRLLLLGCSDTKRADPGALPALERYDGPFFRVLRAHARRGGSRLPTLILSARYGLIDALDPIPWYDLRMSRALGAKWAADPAMAARLAAAVAGADAVFAAAGEDYLRVFDAWLGGRHYQAPPRGAGIGVRLGLLKAWLDERSV